MNDVSYVTRGEMRESLQKLRLRIEQMEAREIRLYNILTGCAQFVRERAGHGVDYEVSGKIIDELEEMFVGEVHTCGHSDLTRPTRVTRDEVSDAKK